MISFFARVPAFLARDFHLARSYRLALVLHLASALFALFTYYFLSRLFSGGLDPAVSRYAGDYFSFVLPGVAFSGALLVVLNTYSEKLNYEQLTGTLELLLQGPLSGELLLLGLGSWSVVEQLLMLLVYFGLAWGFFDYSFAACNWPAALLCLLLSVAIFTSLGILAASFILVCKRGNPIAWAFSAFSVLLGGVYYPVEKLPAGLQAAAALLPLTYCLRAFRLAFSRGASLRAVSGDLLLLLGLGLVLLPVSFLAFRFALAICRRRGTIGQY